MKIEHEKEFLFERARRLNPYSNGMKIELKKEDGTYKEVCQS